MSTKAIEAGGTSSTAVEKIVLPEEEYIDKLEKIIQRDYFPEVPQLKAQFEYLDALEKNDVSKIRQLQMKYSCRRSQHVDRKKTPSMGSAKCASVLTEPKDFETPLPGQRPNTGQAWETPAGAVEHMTTKNSQPHEAKKGVADEVDKHTLTTYLSKYISEDNDSYNELIDLEIKRRDAKFPWMKQSEEDHERKFSVNALPCPENAKALQTWPGYIAKNPVLWPPEAAALTHEEADRRNKQSAAKKIIRENTRLTDDVFRKPYTPGSRATPSVSGDSKFDATGNQVKSGKHGPEHEPVVAPSPMPGVNESPMMTWGEIEGTPFLLDASDIPRESSQPPGGGPAFKMPEMPLRDQLALDLAEDTAKLHRQRKQRAVDQITRLTPKFATKKSMERLSSMSPAARRLATAKLGVRIGTDKALAACYTPSPSRSGNRTPVMSSKTPKRPPTDSSLTSNLLTMNSPSNRKNTSEPAEKRSKASDFF